MFPAFCGRGRSSLGQTEPQSSANMSSPNISYELLVAQYGSVQEFCAHNLIDENSTAELITICNNTEPVYEEYVPEAYSLNTSCCFPLGKQYFPVRKLREADLQITSAMCSSAAWRCLLYRPSLRAVSDLVTAAASAWRLCVCSFFFSH